jgi:hypothetical protein
MNTNNTSKVNAPARNRSTLWIGLGIFFLAVIAGGIILLPKLFPKSGCAATLLLGANQYKIQTIKPNSDGTLSIPNNHPDIAYWVEGTDTNYVFGLSPAANNLALETSIKSGDQATITLDNCNSTKYSLSVPQQGVPNNSTLLDQSTSEITVFVQPDSSTKGFVITGELRGETITSFNTPDTSQIQAEVSLLETTTSADGKTIRVGISILNNGQTPITLSTSEVSLTSENATAVALETSEPALPKEIKPGATETFHFTFARPNTKTVTIKVFSAEYELDGY